MPPARDRIAIFVFDLSATGVVRNALALATALGRDHDVDLVTCRGGRLGVEAGVPVTVLGDDARIGPVELALLARRLRAHVRATAPALAISAGNRGHPLFLAALRGVGGFRRIYRFSNDVGHRRGDQAKGLLKRVVDAAQLTALQGDADRIVLVSAHLLAEPRLAAAVASGQAVVIENGVDVDRIRARAAAPAPPELAALAGVAFVLGIGRLTAQKNFATLVDAVALANRTRPLALVILGGGTSAAMAELRVRAAAAGIGERLHLPGVVDNPFAWVVRAGVFALPSWWEGASNVLLEALACGTPIVASATAGNAAAVLDGERYGLIADPGDVHAWAAALLRQTGPAKGRVLPGDRAEAYRLDRTLDAWRRLVAEELARGG